MLNNTNPQVIPHESTSAAQPLRQQQVRLTRQQQEQLVRRYQAGALRRELAETYGIGRGTVSEIIKRHDAQRARGLAPEQIADAARRYEEGQSLAKVAATIGSSPNTVRSRLIEMGVTMRSTAGTAR